MDILTVVMDSHANNSNHDPPERIHYSTEEETCELTILFDYTIDNHFHHVLINIQYTSSRQKSSKNNLHHC